MSALFGDRSLSGTGVRAVRTVPGHVVSRPSSTTWPSNEGITDVGKEFVDSLAQSLNVANNHIWKAHRGSRPES